MQDENKQEEQKKPDEEGSILVSEFLKISDPETGEILVNKRDS